MQNEPIEPENEKIKSDFKEALEDARKTAQRLGITQEDIDAEICAQAWDKQFEQDAKSGRLDKVVEKLVE